MNRNIMNDITGMTLPPIFFYFGQTFFIGFTFMTIITIHNYNYNYNFFNLNFIVNFLNNVSYINLLRFLI